MTIFAKSSTIAVWQGLIYVPGLIAESVFVSKFAFLTYFFEICLSLWFIMWTTFSNFRSNLLSHFKNFFSKCDHIFTHLSRNRTSWWYRWSCNPSTLIQKPEAYSEDCQTPKMELFANIVNGFQALPIFPKMIYHRCLTGVIDIRLSYKISKSNKHWIDIITDDIVV